MRTNGPASARGSRSSGSSATCARLVVRQTGLILLVGLPLGLTGAAGLARWMSTLLFGVRPFDVATYAVVSAVLALAVVAAVIVPARRAMRVDPIIALRME